MNNLNGSPGLTSHSASQRAFATKGIIPDFKDCKWDYEADKDGFQEFYDTFRTVIDARFPEARIIHLSARVWDRVRGLKSAFFNHQNRDAEMVRYANACN